MSLPKIIIVGSLSVFAVLGIVGGIKKISNRPPTESVATLPEKKAVVKPKVEAKKAEPKVVVSQEAPKTSVKVDDFPKVDRIFQLFTTGSTKLPIVETVSYTSNVSWLKGRPAWIADYASYYSTSRHFIARSLNGKPDYFSQKVNQGSRFNVFTKNRPIEFHLVVDLTKCKMGFYYFDKSTNERILLKTYPVGLGRPNSEKVSGFLTPLGTYSLGSKVAIYKPGINGLFQDKNVEMIRIFGTRWMPFDQEVSNCTEMAKGFGIHGSPWVEEASTGALIEDVSGIGNYQSDGCIRLTTADVEEIFSIVITKPTFVHIVRDFHEATLPGVEVASPTK